MGIIGWADAATVGENKDGGFDGFSSPVDEHNTVEEKRPNSSESELEQSSSCEGELPSWDSDFESNTASSDYFSLLMNHLRELLRKVTSSSESDELPSFDWGVAKRGGIPGSDAGYNLGYTDGVRASLGLRPDRPRNNLEDFVDISEGQKSAELYRNGYLSGYGEGFHDGVAFSSSLPACDISAFDAHRIHFLYDCACGFDSLSSLQRTEIVLALFTVKDQLQSNARAVSVNTNPDTPEIDSLISRAEDDVRLLLGENQTDSDSDYDGLNQEGL